MTFNSQGALGYGAYTGMTISRSVHVTMCVVAPMHMAQCTRFLPPFLAGWRKVIPRPTFCTYPRRDIFDEYVLTLDLASQGDAFFGDLSAPIFTGFALSEVWSFHKVLGYSSYTFRKSSRDIPVWERIVRRVEHFIVL